MITTQNKVIVNSGISFNQHGGHHAPHILESRNIMIHYINALIISLRILAAALFASLAMGTGISFIIHLGGLVGWFAGLAFIAGAGGIIFLPYIMGVRLYDER